MKISQIKGIGFETSFLLSQKYSIITTDDLHYFPPEHLIKHKSIGILKIIKLYAAAGIPLSQSRISSLNTLRESRKSKYILNEDSILITSGDSIRLYKFINWQVKNTLDFPYISDNQTLYVYNKKTKEINFIYIPSAKLLNRTHIISIPVKYYDKFMKNRNKSHSNFMKKYDPFGDWYVPLTDLIFTNLRKKKNL